LGQCESFLKSPLAYTCSISERMLRPAKSCYGAKPKNPSTRTMIRGPRITHHRVSFEVFGRIGPSSGCNESAKNRMLRESEQCYGERATMQDPRPGYRSQRIDRTVSRLILHRNSSVNTAALA
jgi:hypothetical protein